MYQDIHQMYIAKYMPKYNIFSVMKVTFNEDYSWPKKIYKFINPYEMYNAFFSYLT